MAVQWNKVSTRSPFDESFLDRDSFKGIHIMSRELTTQDNQSVATGLPNTFQQAATTAHNTFCEGHEWATGGLAMGIFKVLFKKCRNIASNMHCIAQQSGISPLNCLLLQFVSGKIRVQSD